MSLNCLLVRGALQGESLQDEPLPLTCFGEVNMKDFIPIRIRCCDKMSASTQQPDISMVKTEAMHFSQACYMVLEMEFGVLCGSI